MLLQFYLIATVNDTDTQGDNKFPKLHILIRTLTFGCEGVLSKASNSRLLWLTVDAAGAGRVLLEDAPATQILRYINRLLTEYNTVVI